MKSSLIILFILIYSSIYCQDYSKYDKIADSLKQLNQEDKIIPYFENVLKLNPKNELALRFIGSLYINNNQLDLAEKVIVSAIDLNENCANCYRNLARIYAIKNDFIKAIEKIGYGLKIEPNNVSFLSFRSEIKALNKDYLGSSIDINRAIELDPKNGDLYISRAKLNELKSANILALRDYDKAIQLDPTNASFFYDRSNYYFNQLMFKESLKDVNSAIIIDSTNANLYVGRGAVCANLDDIEGAIFNYTKAIELDSNNSMCYYNRSLSRYSLEDMDGACEDKNRALSLFLKFDPENELIELIEKDLADFCDSKKPSYYYQRGIAMFNLKRYKESIDIYTLGLSKFPLHSLLLNFRANSNLSSHNYRMAIKDYEESFKNMDVFKKELASSNELANKSEEFNTSEKFIHSLLYTSYYSIAECYFYMEKFDSAFAAINKGIEMLALDDRTGVESLFTLRGNIFIAKGRFKDAIVDFNRSIEINKIYGNAYVYRAFAKINLENDTLEYKNRILFLNNEYGIYYTWSLPEKIKINKNDQNILSAVEDCKLAINLDPSFSYSYYLKGYASQKLGLKNCCDDYDQANKLGYPVEIALLKKCGLLKR